ncbi:hypothetical protein P4571_06610 [Niallia alba]|nr:hypothetical protein [Niallia alba]
MSITSLFDMTVCLMCNGLGIIYKDKICPRCKGVGEHLLKVKRKKKVIK